MKFYLDEIERAFQRLEAERLKRKRREEREGE
jgi:hypothetical protein